jgi:hypothetical protein
VGRRLVAVCTLAVALGLVIMPTAAADAARSDLLSGAQATVSGTIRHDGAPVAGVRVLVFWEGAGEELTTGLDGLYAVSGVPAGSWVMIHVIPPLHMRLASHNLRIDHVTGEVVQDFDLVSGFLLSGLFLLPDGAAYDEGFWLAADPVDFMIPDGQWLGTTAINGQFEVVLPPGIFTLRAGTYPYSVPRTRFDLRQADQTAVTVTLLREPEPPFPTRPPLAELIIIGPPDADGVANIVGAAGAVEPLSQVILVNLHSNNVAITTSDASGAFRSRLFAPPGCTVLVKYDPQGGAANALWQGSHAGPAPLDLSFVNPLPGTSIPVGDTLDTTGPSRDFSSAGTFLDPAAHGWAGWWMSGMLTVPDPGTGPGLAIRGGQQVDFQARLRVTSPAMDCSGQVSYEPHVGVHLRPLFGADGRPYLAGVWFNAHLFTPTGLPIELEAPVHPIGMGAAPSESVDCVSANTFEAAFEATFTVPQDLPDGYYMVETWVDGGGVPLATDVPITVVWNREGQGGVVAMARTGSPAPPQIPWVLLGDVPVNGHRGVIAREHAEWYAMPNRPVYPPHQVIIPRLDERSGEAIAYRLEPGCNWLSSTDRRFANPPQIPLALPNGHLTVSVLRPDGRTDVLGPALIRQSSVRTPTTPGGDALHEGTGHISDLYHLTTMDERFAYTFAQYGHHVITLEGEVRDVFGNAYPIQATYDIYVARTLDLDPAQLPTTPYKEGDAFAPGLHIFPPVPADVHIRLVHMPNSDPAAAQVTDIEGRANRFGYLQPPVGTEIRLDSPGEFRVDYTAQYEAPDGTLWMGAMTWGNVVEGSSPQMEAHGRRGMDYHDDTIDDMPAWFEVFQLPPDKVGIENYYPYFSGDVHWGNQDRQPGDSIHSIITVKDLTGSRQTIYNLLRANYPRALNGFRWPPDDWSMAGLNKRIAIGEAPLFITTHSGVHPALAPHAVDQWGYWYGSSERPDVRVRELLSEDNMGTAYWRFNDTYGYQIGEPADGDQAGDLKWEFGGAVLRAPTQGISEYAIYSSLWVLLPDGDPVGARVTPPFQDATGAGINGGPILTLKGQDIDMLFLPKGVRPGDVLELGDTVAFSGHVGPPLDSRVEVTITSPGGMVHSRTWHANKIGWLYDPSFDIVAEEIGRWTVDVSVVHDRPYVGNGVIPARHNTGTVLGTAGQYEFYVVPRESSRLLIFSPRAGFLPWGPGMGGAFGRVQPIEIHGLVPDGTAAVHYTIHDKGIVMGQGTVAPNDAGVFRLIYDARALHEDFPMLSLTAREGRWEGLADEVAINLLAAGGSQLQASTVTLIGEEVFVTTAPTVPVYLPMIRKGV